MVGGRNALMLEMHGERSMAVHLLEPSSIARLRS